MMCPDWARPINEYVDRTLAAAERDAVERHLAGCAGCRSAVGELRRLLASAAGLPKAMVPARDLWVGIEARIGQRATGDLRRAFWRGVMAAAAVLVLAFGLYLLTARPPDRPGEGSQGWVAVEAEYRQAVDDLTLALEAQRGTLRPETVEVIERNLRIIDAAIRESRAALARDPNSAELRPLVSAAYRQKVDLLQWATRVATPTS
ncbi:MAG TPA: zf-HC2 domain-containing protein [Gemmatimonadales bacterium]|nr:zf-HC2 domain-containing protein [Gemmatimonadales bacterium]